MPEPSLSVLSGDVHHSYAARAEWAGDTAQPAGAMVYQLVCSSAADRWRSIARRPFPFDMSILVPRTAAQ